MTISPELEAYFLSFTLVFGIDPTPPDGPVDKEFKRMEIAGTMKNWPHKPAVVAQLERAHKELGIYQTAPRWFYGQLASAYQQWLHTEYSKTATLS